MNNIIVRILLVVAVLFIVQMGFQAVGYIKTPEVIPLRAELKEFPVEVSTTVTGKWIGKDETLDQRTFVQSQAEPGAVTRRYVNRSGNRDLVMFLAEYKEPSVGLYHNPMNCYHSNGFKLTEKVRRPLKTEHRPDTEVSMSTWEKSGEQVVVVYWYEVGDRTLYERDDLLPTQFAMFGQRRWPIMLKVLLEVRASDPNQAKIDVMDMAQAVREWLGSVRPVLD